MVAECARYIGTCCFELTLKNYPELMASGYDAVVAGGGVAALIKVLQDGPEDAKGNVATALVNVASHKEGVGAAVGGGGVPALIEVL